MRRAAEYFLWTVLFLLILVSPLALAYPTPTPFLILRSLVFLACAVLVWRALYLDRVFCWVKTPANGSFLLFLGLSIIQLLLPREFLSYLGGAYDKGALYESVFKLIFYGAIYFLTLNLVKNEKEISRLIRCLFVAFFSICLLGLIQNLSKANKILWTWEVKIGLYEYRDFFATFIGPNQFAAFAGMVVFLLLGRFVYLNVRYGGFRGRARQSEKVFLLFVLMVSSAALFISLSRGAGVLFLLTLGLFARFLLWDKKGRQHMPLLIAFAAGTFLMLLWIGMKSVVAELSTLVNVAADVSLLERLKVWQAAARHVWAVSPVTGIGLGSFRHAFPLVQPTEEAARVLWDHAHNEWVEVFFETGLVGFLITVLAVLAFYRHTFSLHRDQSDPYIKYIGAGSVHAVTFMLLMCCYDFPLRNWVCAVYFAVIAALALKLKCIQDEHVGKERVFQYPIRSTMQQMTLSLAGMVMLLVVLAGIIRPYRAWRIVEHGGSRSLPHLEEALKWDPWNAEYHYLRGLALAREAFYGGAKYLFNAEKMKMAEDSVHRALVLRPDQGKFIYGLALIAQGKGDKRAALNYYRLAAKKDFYNPYYHLFLALFCFNEAVQQSVIENRPFVEMMLFKEGVGAYLKARRGIPGFDLSQYQSYLTRYTTVRQTLDRELWAGSLPQTS